MRTWIGLFRGINVGGHHKVPMKDLVTVLRGLGFEEVRSYIQSGNVVFRASGTAAALIEDIGTAVSRRFGFPRARRRCGTGRAPHPRPRWHSPCPRRRR
ncbi:MAG: DUF1697 domain-containing protein [Gammaproteobacteria bacterium]|nr:MAG: DUF1697 domain-containing protein [Gammaproteobacteria bacterium]